MPSWPLRGKLSMLQLTRNTIRYVPAQYPRYYIDLCSGFSTYLERLPHRFRGELRRKVRRFIESSGSSPIWREYRDPADMAEFYGLAHQVSKRSFQGRLGGGLPETEEFRSQLALLAQQNLVRGFILCHGDRPVAYELSRANGDCLTGEYCGYDPEFRRSSPGTVLLYCVLEHLFVERSFTKLDLGTGDAEYKALLATGSILCGNLYYFRRSGRNLCLVGAHCAVRGAWRCIARTLDIARVRGRLKKLLRSGGTEEQAQSPAGSFRSSNRSSRHT
jgi:hypothetical protein